VENIITSAPPIFMKACMVVSGVVQEQNNSPSCFTAFTTDQFQKRKKRFTIKNIILALVYKFTIAKTNGTEISNTFSRWMVEQHWLFHFRWNPHAAPRTILLEMDFIT
jgi:hypothetical protein